MATWKFFRTRKFLSWKSLSIFLTIILIPFIISLFAGYTNTNWFTKRRPAELTCNLDGWINVGRLTEGGGLDDLTLRLKDRPVNNVMKVSWRITNTGDKGILGFEQPPLLIYPRRFNVIEAKVSDKSPLLEIDEYTSIESEVNTVEVSDISLLNPGEFLKLDIYIVNMDDSEITDDYFADWKFAARALDLQTKMNTACDIRYKEPKRNLYLLSLYIFSAILIFVYLSYRQRKRVVDKAVDEALLQRVRSLSKSENKLRKDVEILEKYIFDPRNDE